MDVRGAVDLSRAAHERDDVDFGLDSHHHTLGGGPFQGAPGNHNHDKKYKGLMCPTMSVVAGAAQAIGAGAWTRVAMAGLVDQAIPSTPDYNPATYANSWFNFNSGLSQILLKKPGLYWFHGHLPLTNTGASIYYIRGRHVDGWAGGGKSPRGRRNESAPATLGAELEFNYPYYIPDGLSSFAMDAFFGTALNTMYVMAADETIRAYISVTYLGSIS